MLLTESQGDSGQQFLLSVSYGVSRDMVAAVRLVVGVEQDPMLRECPAVSHSFGRSLGGPADRQIVPIDGPQGGRFFALLEREQTRGLDQVYNARVLGAPGCQSYGHGSEEAIANLREALELYLDD